MMRAGFDKSVEDFSVGCVKPIRGRSPVGDLREIVPRPLHVIVGLDPRVTAGGWVG